MTAPGLEGKRVAVLYTPVEKSLGEVSEKMREAMDLAVSARAVADALAAGGVDARIFPLEGDIAAVVAALRSFGAEAVFNLCECPLNSAQKEGHGAAFLELLRLPYTGNGPFALSICNNKPLAKRILTSYGIDTPPFRLFEAPPTGPTGFVFPAIVKPAREDGSAGITEASVVEDEAALAARVAHVIAEYNQEALVEQFIGGREFNVAILGNGTSADPHRILPPAELVYRNPRWRICFFNSKWDPQHPAYSEIAPECPARIDDSVRRHMETLALACARAFSLSGYSRIDFRAGENGRLFVLEVNPNPDISPDAGLARAARAAGLSYQALVLEILRLGMARGPR